MKVSVGTAQWIGERERQEDSLAYGVGPDGRYLLVLTDGMGGHAGGDIASRLTSSVALEAMFDPYNTIPEALSNAISRSNSAISDHVESSPECDGMGTTLVCAVVENGKLWWSSVGDSHLYLLRSGDVKKLNADHSMMPVLQKMVSEGEITTEQAAADPKRNALRSAVMGGEIPLIDISKQPFDLRKGDTIVLCSDGVDSIDNLSSLEAAVTSQNNAQNAANNLIEAVKAVGRPRQDNTSVVVAQIGGERAPIQVEAQNEGKSNTRDVVRRLVLPGVTLALSVTTLWSAVSSWRADSALQKSRDKVEEMITKNSALTEQLEITKQAVNQVGPAQIRFDAIAIAIADNDNVSEKLTLLIDDDLPEQGVRIINFMIDILSKNHSLLAELSDNNIQTGKNKQALASLVEALSSDNAPAARLDLILSIEDELVQSQARVIIDNFQNAEGQARDALQASNAMGREIVESTDRLTALTEAITKDDLAKFIELYPDTAEAEIARLISELLVKQHPIIDPATANGQSKN